MEQISFAVAMGVVKAGDKLPPVRKLAAQLVVNPNTVANAYRHLEKEGLLTTKAGLGTFVSNLKAIPMDAFKISALGQYMDTVISRGLNLGISGEGLAEMFKKRVEGFTRKL
jgi:GntR family transcriptional regulator